LVAAAGRHGSIIKNFSMSKFVGCCKIEVLGHSVGGYTALALAGGTPHTQALVQLCPKPAHAGEPYWLNFLRKNGINSQPLEVTADSRIKAVVLLAPDVSLFMSAGALRHVHAPVLLLLAEEDYMPLETIDVLSNGLPDRSQLTHRMVPHAGHYSFLSPFPESIKPRVGDAARDPAGFDRDQFHQELNPEVLNFLQSAWQRSVFSL
jgi:predicted dienelactone hydrolase